jgi:hypothetical protein
VSARLVAKDLAFATVRFGSVSITTNPLLSSAQEVAASNTETVPEAKTLAAGINTTNGRSRDVNLSKTEEPLV